MSKSDWEVVITACHASVPLHSPRKQQDIPPEFQLIQVDMRMTNALGTAAQKACPNGFPIKRLICCISSELVPIRIHISKSMHNDPQGVIGQASLCLLQAGEGLGLERRQIHALCGSMNRCRRWNLNVATYPTGNASCGSTRSGA